MIYAGLVSVTFRQLKPEDIIELAVEAGMDGIEWGGDVHVPHGDVGTAERVKKMTEQAGLRIAAYGSYFRFTETPGFDEALASAKALGAPLIRVWAGNLGSEEADQSWRDYVARKSWDIAEQAAETGIAVAYEYHGKTLTDTPESAEALLRSANHPNLHSYWQPLPDHAAEERLPSLRDVRPWLSHLHVYHWLGRDRRPLEEGRGPWLSYLREASKAPGQRFASLEFVKDDDPAQFLQDAAVLKEMLAAVHGGEHLSE